MELTIENPDINNTDEVFMHTLFKTKKNTIITLFNVTLTLFLMTIIAVHRLGLTYLIIKQ